MNQPKRLTKSIKLALFFSFALIFGLSSGAHASQFQTIQPNIVSEIQTNELAKNKEDSVYTVVEKMPEFPGGEKAVISFLNQTISYPAEAQKKNEQGKVIVQFTISKTGKVENAKVIRSVSPSLDNEALRLIGLLPDWTPGEQNGEKVAVYRVIPVMFQIPTEESVWEVNDKTVIVIDGVKMPANFNTKILNQSKLISASILKPFPKETRSKLIEQYGKLAANGVILITSNKDETYYTLADSTINPTIDSECKEPAVMPEFQGGKAQLLSYFADSLQYPFVAKRTKTEGKVIVRFLVDQSGKISGAKVMRSVDYFLDKEALRVINTMPNWIAGAKCDKKLAIIVTMPVIFKLDLPAAEKGWEKNDKTIVLLDGERLPSSFDLGWLNYGTLSGYKVLQPTTKEITKKLVKEYGKDAVNGVIVIESKR